MGGELSLKLPFTLMHTCSEFDPTWTRELGSPKVDVPASDETKSGRDDTWDEEEEKEKKKVVVEINKTNEELHSKLTSQSAVRCNKTETKVTKPNLDEIITQSRGETDESADIAETIKRSNAENKDKNFSIPRAWCCLTGRRTS